jgi:hypothetical protein
MVNQSRKNIAGWYGAPAHGANPSFRAPHATTTAKGNGNGRQTTRKGLAPFPFREVTVLTETYLEVQGLDGESFDLVSCPRCAALIPTTGKSGDKAEKAHRGFHEQIDAIDQRSS